MLSFALCVIVCHPRLLKTVVVSDLEVPKLGLHVVVLFGDPAVFLGQLLIALFAPSVRLLISLKKMHKKQRLSKTTKSGENALYGTLR